MTVTRFAPSPTGYLHVGNLRTALFNFLIAKKAGGTFILRLDDTDPERSKQEYADQIQRDLEWLGLTWDRIEKQSDRLDRYAAAADELREKARFYEAWETPTELDLKRKKQLNMGQPPVYDRAALKLGDDEKAAMRAERGQGVWRFKLKQERIEWTDGILGDLSIDAASVSDPVLIRQDGQVLYTLASVVDDTDMGVTHVVRGSDHVTNTATQIQIMEALGFSAPSFAHHSLLTGPQGEALSKRLGTLALKDLRENGVEPMALLSHMARLGSSQPVELCRRWTSWPMGSTCPISDRPPPSSTWTISIRSPRVSCIPSPSLPWRTRWPGSACRMIWPRHSGTWPVPTSPRGMTLPAGGSCSATGRRRSWPTRIASSWPRPSPCCPNRPTRRRPGKAGPTP